MRGDKGGRVEGGGEGFSGTTLKDTCTKQMGMETGEGGGDGLDGEIGGR